MQRKSLGQQERLSSGNVFAQIFLRSKLLIKIKNMETETVTGVWDQLHLSP